MSTIEAAFEEYTNRPDIAILLINQHVRPSFSIAALSSQMLNELLIALAQVADKIRHHVERYEQAFPALLEIPSKDHPYGTAAASRPSSCSSKVSTDHRRADPSKDSVLKRVRKLFGE